jgi:hypothetical protein
MEPKKRIVIVAVMLMLSCLNYARIEGTENVRSIVFISILGIGILLGLLISLIATAFKKKE